MSNSRRRFRAAVSLRAAFGLLIAAAIAMAIAACGSTSSSSTQASQTSTSSAAQRTAAASSNATLARYLRPPTDINVTGSLKSAPPAGKSVVMLTTTDPGTSLIATTVASVAAAAHWNYTAVSYDPANLATLNAAYQTAITKHANYIIETGIVPPQQDLKAAAAAGIKVALGSLPNPVPPAIVDAASSASLYRMGAIVGQLFVSDSGGKGEALVANVPAYPILATFAEGFDKTVTSSCPGCKVDTIDVSIPDVVSGKLPSAVVSALQSHSSARYAVFEDAAFSTGIVPALAAASLSGRVKVIGGVSNTQVLSYLRQGTNTAWAAFSSPYEAYQLMDAVFRSAEGLPVSQAEEGVEPTQLLTKDNVGTLTNWNAPVTFPQQFKALWHLS